MKLRKTKAGVLVSSITKADVEALFHLPSGEAARQLGVGLTVLKRLCRSFGIERWPYARPKAAGAGAATGAAPRTSNHSNEPVGVEWAWGVGQEGGQLGVGSAISPGLPSQQQQQQQQQQLEWQLGQRSCGAGPTAASPSASAAVPRPRLPAGQLYDYIKASSEDVEAGTSPLGQLGPKRGRRRLQSGAAGAARPPAAAAAAAPMPAAPCPGTAAPAAAAPVAAAAAAAAAPEAAAAAHTAMAVTAPAALEIPKQAAVAGAPAQLRWAEPAVRTVTSLHMDYMQLGPPGPGLFKRLSPAPAGSSDTQAGGAAAANTAAQHTARPAAIDMLPDAPAVAALCGPACGNEPNWPSSSVGHSGQQAVQAVGPGAQLAHSGPLTASQQLQDPLHAVSWPGALPYLSAAGEASHQHSSLLTGVSPWESAAPVTRVQAGSSPAQPAAAASPPPLPQQQQPRQQQPQQPLPPAQLAQQEQPYKSVWLRNAPPNESLFQSIARGLPPPRGHAQHAQRAQPPLLGVQPLALPLWQPQQPPGQPGPPAAAASHGRGAAAALSAPLLTPSLPTGPGAPLSGDPAADFDGLDLDSLPL